MKKLFALALSLSLLGTLTPTALRAADVETHPKKGRPTEEQKELRKALLAKYDTNKDGKLDKEERAKISAEDKEKLIKAGLARGAHKKGGADGKDAAK
jgi:hypothetical protein